MIEMRQRGLDINARESLKETATPHGTVGVVHAGRDLKARWIDKHGDETSTSGSCSTVRICST